MTKGPWRRSPYSWKSGIEGNNPFPKGEDAIAKDPLWSYRYARDILKAPFFKGEEAIATDPKIAYKYARYVIKGPFPKGEKRILNASSDKGRQLSFPINGVDYNNGYEFLI